MNPTQPPECQTVPCQHILVVEDDPEIRRLCQAILLREGHRVDAAADGQDGWERLLAANTAGDPFGLLITDNDMPHLTGVELVERLRAAHLDVPVIMVSGMMPLEAQSLGLAALLWKPFLPIQLTDAVALAVEESRRIRRLPFHAVAAA